MCLLCVICKVLCVPTWKYWKVWLQERRYHRLKIHKLQKFMSLWVETWIWFPSVSFFFEPVLVIRTVITQKCEILSTPVLWSQQLDLNGVVMVVIVIMKVPCSPSWAVCMNYHFVSWSVGLGPELLIFCWYIYISEPSDSYFTVYLAQWDLPLLYTSHFV